MTVKTFVKSFRVQYHFGPTEKFLGQKLEGVLRGIFRKETHLYNRIYSVFGTAREQKSMAD